MATIKTQGGKVITKDGKVSCTCCASGECAPGAPSISGSATQQGTGTNQSGPCVDFITATTTPATVSGLHKCTGGVDDQGNMTWPGGSFFSPSNQPSVGPCFGAHNFEFYAKLNTGDTVSCEAGSWGGPVTCIISCCLVTAP
jgi:hypothetical protein